MLISGKTKIYGVIGDPVEHSLSPAMQNAAFEASRLDCVYLAFRVKHEDAGNALAGMRVMGIQGLNVTMPLKKAVIGFLDVTDEKAKLLNSVNTIKNIDGELCGLNTDGVGALKALRENGVETKGKKIVLLGAGGAARAIAFALAGEAYDFSILNRTLGSAASLADLLHQKFNSKVFAYPLSPSTIKGVLAEADLVINATSIGMKPNVNQTPVPRRWLKKDFVVMDIVYDPLETKLARDARAVGAKVVGGVEMLIHQGAASFEFWTGLEAPVDVMRKATVNHLRKVQKS